MSGLLGIIHHMKVQNNPGDKEGNIPTPLLKEQTAY